MIRIELENWVLAANLQALLCIFGDIVGYIVDADDLIAIDHGLTTTNQEADEWFDYELGPKLRLALARDPGTEIVHVRLECSEKREALMTAVEIAQNYDLRTRTKLLKIT